MRIGRTHGNGSSPSCSVGAAVALCWVELGETPIWTCTKDSGPADWVWFLRRRGGGQGEEGGEASARSEPRLVRACFHAADGCDAPIGLAESSKSSEEKAEEGGVGGGGGGWDALEEICVS